MSRQDKRVDVVLAVELHRSCDWSNLRGGLGYGKYVNGCRACGCVKWLCDLAQMWGVLVPAKGEEKRPISDPFSNGMYGTNVRFLRYVERTRPNQTLTPTRPLPISDYRLYRLSTMAIILIFACGASERNSTQHHHNTSTLNQHECCKRRRLSHLPGTNARTDLAGNRTTSRHMLRKNDLRTLQLHHAKASNSTHRRCQASFRQSESWRVATTIEVPGRKLEMSNV